jgi:hypothetical protein
MPNGHNFNSIKSLALPLLPKGVDNSNHLKGKEIDILVLVIL